MSNSTSEIINNLSNDISHFWEPAKNKIIERQADIVLLTTFFKNWENALEEGETNQQGYQKAILMLPKEQVNVRNSGITENQLLDKVKETLGKPLSSVTEDDVNSLVQKVRSYVAYGNYFDDQIRGAQQRINDLNNQINSEGPMYGDSPDDNKRKGED